MVNLTGPLPDNGVFSNGKTLSNRIDDGEFTNFASVCGCIIKILDALKPIHEKGFLHLGISPDTVRFSDTGTVWLTGHTDAFRIGGDFQSRTPPFWPGYSAGELIRNPNTKPLPLHYATDLYSIAAIFFRLLVGRAPKEGDWSNFRQWRITNQTGYLKGASNLFAETMYVFLRKSLSLTAARRFSDAGEMRKELETLRRQGPK